MSKRRKKELEEAAAKLRDELLNTGETTKPENPSEMESEFANLLAEAAENGFENLTNKKDDAATTELPVIPEETAEVELPVIPEETEEVELPVIPGDDDEQQGFSVFPEIPEGEGVEAAADTSSNLPHIPTDDEIQAMVDAKVKAELAKRGDMNEIVVRSKPKVITFKSTESMHQDIKEYAARNSIKMGRAIEIAMVEFMKKYPVISHEHKSQLDLHKTMKDADG